LSSIATKLKDIDGVIPVAQARSREAQARLLKAGERVFAQKGYDDAHVIDIAAAAKCSVGSFYRRFRDKEALFNALHQQFAERGRQNIDRFFGTPEWSETSAQTVIRQLVENTARVIEKSPGFFRALFQRTLSTSDRRYMAPLRASDKYAAQRLATFLQSRGVKRKNLEEACHIGLRTMEAGIVQRVLHEPDAITQPVITGLAEMLIAYLGVRDTH